jgi:hypothetical protein
VVVQPKLQLIQQLLKLLNLLLLLLLTQLLLTQLKLNNYC